MGLYVIGDTHLSLSVPKSMEAFGGVWENYTLKLQKEFERLTENDVLIIAGDVSWGINLEEALEDFRFLEQFPFKKILLKGNHDLWWETLKKMRSFFADHGLTTFDFLHNNSFLFEGVALCGTKGWGSDDDDTEEHSEKIYNRELCRLEASLKDAARFDPIDTKAFLHYPPIGQQYLNKEMIELMNDYHVSACYYGHLHGFSHSNAFQGMKNGIEFRLISADYLHFQPVQIL